MAIKRKNDNGEWIIDQQAIETSIIDVEGNFESDNVEGALRELAEKQNSGVDLSEIESKIEMNKNAIANIQNKINSGEIGGGDVTSEEFNALEGKVDTLKGKVNTIESDMTTMKSDIEYLKANGGGRGAKGGLYLIDGVVRKPTPIECERLQTLPDNYTACLSDNERRKVIGNGWTVDVIAHIFSYFPDEYKK